MSKNLGEYLANILLEQDSKTIAIFPGAFKPPHKGHFEVVKALSQQADEVIVLISPKSRDGISAEESFEIWNLYKPLLDENVSFKIAASNPVTETYDVIKNNPENKFIVAFGKDEGDRFNQIKNSGKYTNVSIFNAGSFEGLSATGLRNALKTNEDITPFIPEGIDVEEYKSILNIVKPLTESPPIEFEQDDYQDYILQNRDKIEKASAYFNLPIDDMEYAFNAGTPVVLMDDVWSKLQNTNSYNIENLEQAIRYAHSKNLKLKPYIEAIKNNEELPLPLVLQYGQDKYYLVGGEVILALYRALKIQPTVLKAVLNLQINENKIQKKSQIAEFVKFAVNELGIQKLPTVKFSYDTNESQTRGTFGYFDPNNNHIWIYIKNRNTADILRTLAHELVHHKQGEDNRIKQGSGETGSEIENEANAQAGVLLRKFGKENKGIYESKTLFLDIPKFNQPKTFVDNLCESLHEITLSKDNAVEINGGLTKGEFQVDNIIYIYKIYTIPNPYKDEEKFYNISFRPEEDITSIPQGGKENYIKILSTMYKIILNFVEKEKPEYIGISSLDNDGNKNYHKVYANLTDNKLNNIPGYFRKDVALPFDSSAGKGRSVVLKRKKVMNEIENQQYKIYCDMDGVIVDFEEGYKNLTGINIKGNHVKGGADFWQPITDAGVKFWVGLKWMPDGKELWSYIKQYNSKILSAPSREESSKIGKHVWIKNNIPGTKLILKSAPRKQELAESNAILIDDRADNIQQWKNAGGIGILHTTAQDTIKQLQELGL